MKKVGLLNRGARVRGKDSVHTRDVPVVAFSLSPIHELLIRQILFGGNSEWRFALVSLPLKSARRDPLSWITVDK